MVALIVSTIDQDALHATGAHFAEGDFLRAVRQNVPSFARCIAGDALDLDPVRTRPIAASHCFWSFVIVLIPLVSAAEKVTLSPACTVSKDKSCCALNSSAAPPVFVPMAPLF